MFFNCYESVKLDLEKQKELLDICNEKLYELRKYKNCNLTRSRGKYYYMTKSVNGEEQRIYLGCKNNNVVQDIIKFKFYTHASKVYKRNIEAMEALLRKYAVVNVESIFDEVKPIYRDRELISSNLFNIENPHEWKTRMEEKKAQYPIYKPERLVHRTADGTMVRTKSELEYYNEFLRRGYVFIYELPDYFNNELEIPDFTVFDVRTGKVIIVEHFGYMGGDETYSIRTAKKIKNYIMDGYIPGDTLLMFWETLEGYFDMALVCRELDRVLGY